LKKTTKGFFVALGTLSLLFSPVAAFAAPAAASKPVLSNASEANAANDEAQILVSWTASVGPNLIAHSVRLSGGGSTLDGEESCVGTSCTATFTGLTGGTTYTATVVAIDSSGVSSAAATSDQFIALSAPTTPQSRAVAASGESLVLTWNEPASNGGSAITRYSITAPGSDFAGAIVAGGTETYTAVGLTRGNTYTFAIVAGNAVGSSASANFQATIAPNVPSAPSAPTTTASGQNVTVDWVAPADGGSQIQSYVVTLYRDSAVVETANSVDGGLATYDFVVATSGAYKATVAARNAVGLGPASPTSQTATVAGGSALLANLPVLTPSSQLSLGLSQTQAVSATAPSGEPVILRSSTPSKCSLTGGVVTALAQGTCTITATAAATDTYDQGVRTLTILVKLNQTIAFADLPSQSFPGSLDLSGRATANSGESVVFTASGNCSMSSGTAVTMDAAGTCTVSANVPESTGFFAAPQIQKVFSVSAGGSGGGGGGGIVVTPPVQTLRPSLTGTATAGQYLVASPGQWANQESLDFAYRWFSCDAGLTSPSQLQVESSCTVITNAKLIRYLVGELDAGSNILVEVEAVNAQGLATTTYSSTVAYGEEAVKEASGDPAYWPKKLTDSSLKLYAKNVVGAGKVQFFLNGKEIAWVRAIDATDPKLRTANGFSYLVRTVELEPGMKNAVEIYVDGIRERRAAYTVK
jgi:hypothetical protein